MLSTFTASQGGSKLGRCAPLTTGTGSSKSMVTKEVSSSFHFSGFSTTDQYLIQKPIQVPVMIRPLILTCS